LTIFNNLILAGLIVLTVIGCAIWFGIVMHRKGLYGGQAYCDDPKNAHQITKGYINTLDVGGRFLL